jgi:A/G-specific adenine glycosylase
MLGKENFAKILLNWYDREARVLPWRSDPTPYRVWISEMMLQQTRVDTVIPYFNRFVTELPDIQSLAAVDEDKLLKLWQGLGYYSRAMNLKRAAVEIMEKHGGRLPSDRKTLQTLPGIGPYSAGAISSIAFNQVEILMDGNVLRVMARLYGIETDIGDKNTQSSIAEILNQLISAKRPGDFNQAMMELGATRCIPNGAPLCSICPVAEECVACLENRTGEIPFKTQKKPREIQKQTVLLLHYNGKYALEKRNQTGLLAKLWAFPTVEGHIGQEACVDSLKETGYSVSGIRPLPPAKHIFTHVEWHMIGYLVEISALPIQNPYGWATVEEMDKTYAIPKAHSYYQKLIL